MEQLQARLKEVENKLGRVRTEDKFAERTMDLDVVVWNGRVVDEDFFERDFLRQACCGLLPELAATLAGDNP